MSGVHPMAYVTWAIDFGQDHAVDSEGNVYCVLGPGVLIPGGVRTADTHGFRLFLGDQREGGPQLLCISCSRPAPIVLIDPDRLPGR